MIDGLNRPGLKKDVYDLVARLSVEIINRQLPRTQLVWPGITGNSTGSTATTS